MHNGTRPLADTAESVERLSEAEYQSVCAELSATAHGRSFLREYANRNFDPEARKLLATIARLETLRANGPPVPTAELFRSLTDLSAAIERCERIVAENSRPRSEELFAAERIQDIALAMRRREVEPALCDALDAAAREVVDGIIDADAAIKASNAAALLRDLARRVDDIIALASTEVETEAAEISRSDGSARFDATAQEAARDVLGETVQESANGGAPPETVEGAVANAVVHSPESVTVAAAVRDASVSRDASDSCAAIFALSEAELVALFS
jgi:hypothetical protein